MLVIIVLSLLAITPIALLIFLSKNTRTVLFNPVFTPPPPPLVLPVLTNPQNQTMPFRSIIPNSVITNTALCDPHSGHNNAHSSYSLVEIFRRFGRLSFINVEK
jgi:hypothetical protein